MKITLHQPEIRIRVWNIDRKIFEVPPEDDDSYFEQEDEDGPIKYCQKKLCRYQDRVLCLWIGLNDKTGRRIFVGDIVKAVYEYEYEEPWGGTGYALDDFVGHVDYDTESAQYIVRSDMLNSGKKTFDTIRLNRTEIIGNVFQNPELLKC